MELPKVYDIAIHDKVKLEEDINDADNIKIECDNPLNCDNCCEYYLDYCTKCKMLVHILNGNALNNIHNSPTAEIPNGVLEIRKSSEHFGIFALKVIPKGVKFGPFSGLSTAEYPWKLNRGKFVVNKDQSKYLNWMQYINSTSNSSQQNLSPFQFESNLYYHSNREIHEGEELLVYFGKVYEDSLDEDMIIDFIPTVENSTRDVFGCTFCCLGFSSKTYLIKHKSICMNQASGRFLVKELIQCPSCKIYLDKDEYSEYHITYCSEGNVRLKTLFHGVCIQKKREIYTIVLVSIF